MQACSNETKIPQSVKTLFEVEKSMYWYGLGHPRIYQYVLVHTEQTNWMVWRLFFSLLTTGYNVICLGDVCIHIQTWKNMKEVCISGGSLIPDILGCPGISQDENVILGYPGISQDVLGHPRMSWDIPGYPFLSRRSGFHMTWTRYRDHVDGISRSGELDFAITYFRSWSCNLGSNP